jgi:hypothetical protein
MQASSRSSHAVGDGRHAEEQPSFPMAGMRRGVNMPLDAGIAAEEQPRRSFKAAGRCSTSSRREQACCRCRHDTVISG